MKLHALSGWRRPAPPALTNPEESTMLRKLTTRFVPLLAGACAVAAPAIQAQQTVRLPAADRPLALRAQTVYQVGKEDGRSWEVLSNVRQVTIDRAENLYVLDRGNARVLVFDRTGRFVRQVGKRGGGPGEFTSPGRMAVTSDGRLVVADEARQAFSIFGPDGGFVRSVPFERRFGMSGFGLAAHPRGGVVTGTEPIPLPGLQIRNSAVVWYSLGANDQAKGLFELSPEVASTSASVESGRSNVTVQSTRKPAFSPVLRWDVLPGGGVVAGNTASYVIQVRNPAGQVTRTLERAIRPRAVTQRDKDAEIERRKGTLSQGGMVPVGGNSGAPAQGIQQALARSALDDLEFAAVLPVIQDLGVDHAGRIWVQRSGPVAGRAGPVDVLTAEGRYLGTLAPQAVPDAFGPGGRAAYIVRDDLGVERVVVRSLSALGQ
jgi:hypothetical protein